MIRCVVVDDEKHAREEIKYLLDKEPFFEVVAEGENGLDAVNAVNRFHPDVLFCDMEMPILNGLEVGKFLLENGKEVILVYITAYDDYAIKAFEMNALDYLLKPISECRFHHMVEKLKNQVQRKEENRNALQKTIEKMNIPVEQLCLYREGIIYPIKLEEIIYLHTEEKLTRFITTKGIFENYKPLSEIEQILPQKDFFKCHRAYIINVKWIESIIPWSNRSFHIHLKGQETEIPVSRQNAGELKQRFQIFG